MIDSTIRMGIAMACGGCLAICWGCPGSLRVETDHAAPDDDDDTADDDDDASDDDTGDDDTGDDDTADDDDTGDDDTSAPDMTYWNGDRTVTLDFADYAEDNWGVEDCEAPYDLVGPNVTGQYQSLCPLCWHIFQLSHNPAPVETVEECVAQVYWEATSFERLYGIQMLDDTAFVLWRNFGNLDSALEEYGVGEVDGHTFWYTTDPVDYGWYSYWAAGEGTFGQ